MLCLGWLRWRKWITCFARMWKVFFKSIFSLFFSKICMLLISSWMQLRICCMYKTVKHYSFSSPLSFSPNPQLMFIRCLLFLSCFVCMDNDFCLAPKYLNLWNSDHSSSGGRGRKGKRFLSPCWMLLPHLICCATSSEYDYKEVVWAFSVSLCFCDLHINYKPGDVEGFLCW